MRSTAALLLVLVASLSVLSSCGSEQITPPGGEVAEPAQAAGAPAEAPQEAEQAQAAEQAEEEVKPGPRQLDPFHPDAIAEREAGTAAPAPAFGGRIVMHLESMPKNFNRVVENSAVTRNLHYMVHESLAVLDWESWEYEPRLCHSWDLEDMIVLNDDAAEKYGDAVVEVKVKFVTDEGPKQVLSRVVYGAATDNGESWTVRPVSKGSALSSEITIAKSDISVVEQGTVFTFNLRDDVVWHPATGDGATGKDGAGSWAEGDSWEIKGHKMDARDVYFSWSLYANPEVDCDEVRFQFEKMTRCDVVDDHTVRMFYESQYFAAIGTVGVDFSIIPSHIYDLSDPDNPKCDPNADMSAQAAHVNDEPHNQMYVGLGPYRVTAANQQFVEAHRFDDYFLRDDPKECGYFDVIRYRMIDDDNAAFQALINEELDFFYRIKSSDYFGSQTQAKAFTDNFYKGYYYFPSYGFTCWNLYQAALQDLAVRKAIAHCFDFEEYARTNYKGLVKKVTGPMPYFSNNYNHSIKPYPYDPDLALELLEDAEWYDSDGNGIADKDGVELKIEFLMPFGNEASKNFGLKLQESLSQIGIRLEIAEMEWATFLERLKNRDFDAGNLAWMSPLEPDPEQTWHSKWGAPDKESSNNSGLRDEQIDAWIEAGQRELDPDKRREYWHKIHARLHDLQPYLFMYCVPRKFGMNKKIRGYQAFSPRPGYYPRRWHYPQGTPGTRSTIDIP